MREPRYPLPRVVLVSVDADAPPGHAANGASGGWQSVLVFLGAFRAGVCFFARPDAWAGGRRGGAGSGLPPGRRRPVYERVRGFLRIRQ
jgi:hypothetical protein